ncbi:copper homeostasis protein cutC homolog [Ochlerotatus camptorhynchus]|uniref:copper homeostasis protein cutC homolog n=1 Tax=Ochlerotatus camptorhynchus TaxID=644619 RepID=UPI0031DF9A18
MAPLLEICIDSFESASAAIRGGADRLEVCAALSEGGLTPSVGLLREIRNFIQDNYQNSVVQLYAMIRCRRGSDFCYSETEMKIMLHDLALLAENGADGFVFGALNDSGEVHPEYCTMVMVEALKLKKPVTFHRAFDCTDRSKMLDNLTLIESLGFTTVLTSGFESTAVKGIDNLMDMIKFVEYNTDRSRLTIMPGSGVSPGNAQEIVQKTDCKAIHASARSMKMNPKNRSSLSMGGNADDGEDFLVCDEAIVKEIKMYINSI